MEYYLVSNLTSTHTQKKKERKEKPSVQPLQFIVPCET